jgi:hypothetical protein
MATAPYWDYFLISGSEQAQFAKSPGLAKVRGAGTPRNWDVQKGYGISGAFCVYTGAGLAEFSIDVFLWLNSHWPEWDNFAKLLEKPTKAVRPRALSITHPLLTKPPIRITQAVVKDVSQFEYNESTQLWACEIKFLQFKAPAPILSKPKASIPGGAPATPTAQDEYEKKILQMMDQVKNL